MSCKGGLADALKKTIDGAHRVYLFGPSGYSALGSFFQRVKGVLQVEFTIFGPLLVALENIYVEPSKDDHKVLVSGV